MKKAVSVSEYFSLAQTLADGTRDFAPAFRAALAENERVSVPRGTYTFWGPVEIPSGRRIDADREARFLAAPGAGTCLFRTKYEIGHEGPLSEDIVLCGGIYDGAGCGGAYDENASVPGVGALLFFGQVRGLTVRNIRLENASSFALQLAGAEDFSLTNVRLENCSSDGIHVGGYTAHGVIRDVTGETGDDFIALNAYDWDASTPQSGPIRDIRIERVRATGKKFRNMRFLAAKAQGVDCFIRNISVRRTRGVDNFKLYLQTPAYREIPQDISVGTIENLSFLNIIVDKTKPSDPTKYALSADPVFGHFGIFEIASEVCGLSFSDVRATLPRSEYPSTAHFMTIGPKSCYLPDPGIEIFDPTVFCTVRNVSFRRVRVDGKPVTDPQSVAYLVDFSPDGGKGEFLF